MTNGMKLPCSRVALWFKMSCTYRLMQTVRLDDAAGQQTALNVTTGGRIKWNGRRFWRSVPR